MKRKYKRTFTIDRATWRCGGYGVNQHGTGPTELLNQDGFMCCLGHIAIQCRIPAKGILDAGAPCCIDKPTSTYEKIFVTDGHDNELANSAIRLNDKSFCAPANRERDLASLFAEHGYLIRFKGQYRKGKTP